MDNHTAYYHVKENALIRAKQLKSEFGYAVVIKDKFNKYWVHTTPQDLNGDKLVVEMKGE